MNSTPDPLGELKAFQARHDFLVGIDSDGCVFDSMEIKQKECFAPTFIRVFELQAISKYAREVWEFVNLYSKSRGCNRFLAVAESMRLLAKRPEIQARKVTLPDVGPLEEWLQRESRLGNDALKQEVEGGNQALAVFLEYSLEANRAVEIMVRGVPPFPLVSESLEKLTRQADAIVVSQTPLSALEREWEEHGLRHFVRLIAGQEQGTKSEHLAMVASGRFPGEKILVIGDAPGDYKAARANQALFFPIIPGREEESWARLLAEGLDRFFAGTYAGEFERGLVREFDSALPERPPWE